MDTLKRWSPGHASAIRDHPDFGCSGRGQTVARSDKLQSIPRCRFRVAVQVARELRKDITEFLEKRLQSRRRDEKQESPISRSRVPEAVRNPAGARSRDSRGIGPGKTSPPTT